jgi:hypothetical protein
VVYDGSIRVTQRPVALSLINGSTLLWRLDSQSSNPDRPVSSELTRREHLLGYMEAESEDELIREVLLWRPNEVHGVPEKALDFGDRNSINLDQLRRGDPDTRQWTT